MTEPEDAAFGADFTLLAGVGPKTAKALRAAGITTMMDLAASSTGKLVQRLEAAGVPVAESKIISQRWLFQAWEQVRGDDIGDSPDPGSAVAQRGDIEHVEEGVENDDDDGADEPSGDWEEHASFIVSFDRRLGPEEDRWQTRVWDTKSMVERATPGTDSGPWVDFILKQAKLT